MRDYVAGLMFSEDFSKVALIKKNRPDKQKGKYNGIGGQRNYREQPIQCMIREFEEETGVKTKGWYELCLLKSNYSIDSLLENYNVYFYWSTGDLTKLQSKTDEEIEIVNLDDYDWFKYSELVPPLKTILKLVEDRYSIKLGFDKIILEAY